MPPVVLDVSEGAGGELRGWGRYVARLAQALGDAVVPVVGRLPGPEVLWEQVGLPRALSRRGAALVHAPNCFLPLVRPCPGVVTVHDLAFEAFPADFAPRTRWKYATFTPRAVHSAERVIVPSTFTAEDLERRYGVHPSKIRVIPEAPALPVRGQTPPEGDRPRPEGTDPAGRGQTPTRGGQTPQEGDRPLRGGDRPRGEGTDPFLLAVGDVRLKKNLGVARAAAEQLGMELVIVGVGGPLGYVDDARLDALMRGAACLVHPSLYEGFGLVVLEAMARGTPVACADATALPETAGGAAELFDPHDARSCADAIERAIARGGERGREHAARFSWERTAQLTREVYEELL